MAEPAKTTDRQPWYDVDQGLLDRRIYTDPEIYNEELEKIFARAWNFVCHETQIPEPGDFFMNWIGEDEVIVVRDRSRRIQVLLNSCAHRGNTVCRAEQGNTSSFLCSYHGWNYDLTGTLIGMPGEDDYYHGDVDKSRWGLARAAQVDSYKGFVFATMDPSAPSLDDYLGWVGRLGIDTLATHGNLVAVDGVVKNRVKCNWKLAVDNLYDWYHVKISHGSAIRAGLLTHESMSYMDQMVILGEYGHGIGGPGLSEAQIAEFDARMAGAEGEAQWYDLQAARRSDPKVRETLGPIGTRCFGHPNIFPNLWVALTRQVCLRIPRGPLETELWWFTFLPEDISEEERRNSMFMANHVFGPAGLLEQDDGENWSHSTRGSLGAVTRRQPHYLRMGQGHDRVAEDDSGQRAIETVVNEHGQRWNYQSWQEWMLAESWDDLIANHSQPPEGTV